MLRRLGHGHVAASVTCGQVRHASKAAGGNTKYQARPKPAKPKPFLFDVDGCVKGGQRIKEQKHRYHIGKPHERGPQYWNGDGVHMGSIKYTLVAKTDGILKIRESRSNPAFKWVEIDPDIRKVKEGRSLRKEMFARNMATHMFDGNKSYADEREELADPDWRIRDLKVERTMERFPDPNLMTRGVSWSGAPKPRYVANK